MPAMIYLFTLLFSFSAFAIDGRTLQNKVTHLRELQTKIQSDCLNSPNRNNVRVIINGTTLTCGHLIVLANRLRQQLSSEIEDLQESCSQSQQTEAQRLARTTAQAAQQTACRPVSTDAQCLPQYACAAFAIANPLAALIGGAQRLAGNRRGCLAQGAGAAPGCLQNVVKGIFDSLWGLLSLVWDVGRAAVRTLGEWTGLIRRQERSSSERLMAAQQAGPGFISRFIRHPIDTMNQMITSMFNGIKTAAMSSYGCEQWSGAPFVSRCLRPMTNWNCASCQQKLQLMCGIAGFAIGEIGTALLTGGLAAGGRAIAVAALNGVRAGARASRFSRLASGVIRAIPRPPPAVLRAAGTVLEATAVTLSASQRAAIASFRALTSNPVTRAIGTAVRAVDQSIVGQATRFTLRPAAFYLDAMEEAAALGYRTVDGAVARLGTTGARTAADTAELARVSEASRPQGMIAPDAVPPEARSAVTLNPTETRTLAGNAEVDGALDDIAVARTTGDGEVATLPTVAPEAPVSSGGIVVRTEEVVPGTRQPAAITVANDSDGALTTLRTADNVPPSSSVISLPGNSGELRVVTPGRGTRTLTPSNDNFIELGVDSQRQLRSAGLDPDQIIQPFPAREGRDLPLATAESQRQREIAWTRSDLEGRFSQWRQGGVYDDIFATLRTLGSEQEKRRYLAILLNSPQAEVRATLQRLRAFRTADEAGKARYFNELDRRVSDIGNQITTAEALPAGLERTERLAALARQRSALLQERTLLMAGDDLEITNIFTARASNQNYLDKDYIPHSLDDSFSVDLRVKRQTSVCRGSYAGAGAASGVVGSFLTFCRDSNFNDRNGLQRYLAAPGDRERIGRSTSGYERFNRFDLRDGDNITLGLNGPVTYTDAGQLGTGGLGGGIELFTYRAPRAPVSIDRLSGSVRIPSCARADCEDIFRIQESINPRILANQSDVGRYLQTSSNQVNTVITRLEPRIDDYVRALTEGGDPNLIRFREDFADVRSAFNLRREIELKRATPVGALDADAAALRDFTRSAESLGDEVAARIRAQGITDPETIQRMYREAIDTSPLARTHAENLRFMEDGIARLRTGTLSPAERNELLYQLSIRAGSEEDLALAFRTLDYKAGQSAASVGGNRTAVSDYVKSIQGNGLTRAAPLDPRITPELQRAAGLGDVQRIQEASVVLERQLSRTQQDAILRAHDVGAGSGRGFFTYTPDEIARKGLILREAGFSAPEIRTLIERGITGSLPTPGDLFADARRAVLNGRDLRGRIADGRVTDVPEAMREMRGTFRTSAQGYAAEGVRTQSPQFIGESWRLYAKAGDSDAALRMMQTGVRDFGMNQPAIIRSVDQELARLDREIATRSNPAIILERDTLRQVRGRLNPPTQPTVNSVTSTAPTAPVSPVRSPAAPQVTPQVTPPTPVLTTAERELARPVASYTPRDAAAAANEYRLGTGGRARNSQRASELYYRGADGLLEREIQRTRGFPQGGSRFMEDRNFSSALEESLNSNGQIATQMIDDIYARGTYKGLNSFLAENFQRFNTRNPSALQRENIRKMIDHLEEINRRDNSLFDPQRNYLRSWRSANSE